MLALLWLPLNDPSLAPLAMSKMRAVMTELQQTFQVSDRAYETYELSSRPVDDLPATSDEERYAGMAEALAAVEAASGGTWLYLAGAGLVLVAVSPAAPSP